MTLLQSTLVFGAYLETAERKMMRGWACVIFRTQLLLVSLFLCRNNLKFLLAPEVVRSSCGEGVYSNCSRKQLIILTAFIFHLPAYKKHNKKPFWWYGIFKAAVGKVNISPQILMHLSFSYLVSLRQGSAIKGCTCHLKLAVDYL